MTSGTVLWRNSKSEYELGTKGEEIPTLPAGIYRAVIGAFGRRLIFDNGLFQTDKLITLENSNTQKVIQEIDSFLKLETRQAFLDYELLYRRGILLWGPPGTGKTSTVIQICREFVERYNGIVFISFPINEISGFISEIRTKDEDRPVMLVMEELDSKLDTNEEDILDLLDGESNIDNLIVLATTNYIDKIPNRVKSRPSRFATVIEIGKPSQATRAAFLHSRIRSEHKNQIDINQIAEITQDFTIDHLKELIVCMFCFRIPPVKAVEKMKEMIATEDQEDV